MHVELADGDRAGLSESVDNRAHRGVGHEIGEDAGSIRGPYTGRVKQVLMCRSGFRAAGPRSVTGREFGIEPLRLQQRLFGSQGDEAVQISMCFLLAKRLLSPDLHKKPYAHAARAAGVPNCSHGVMIILPDMLPSKRCRPNERYPCAMDTDGPEVRAAGT